MDLNEIRFPFLYGLFQKANGEHVSDKFNTSEIVKMQNLDQVDEKSVIDEITYLNREGLIGGDYADGKNFPSYVCTTNWGIETIEQIMNDTIAYFLQNPSNEISPKLEEIQKIESTLDQYKNILEFSKSSDVFKNKLDEKISLLISDPGF